MNTTLSNIKKLQPLPDNPSQGYQEIKLLSVYHRDGNYHVLGPLPITREAETALRLWVPSMDPDFLELHQFTYLGVRSVPAFRFFWELLAVWKGKGGSAITFEDSLQALNNAQQPGRAITLRWGAEARYEGV